VQTHPDAAKAPMMWTMDISRLANAPVFQTRLGIVQVPEGLKCPDQHRLLFSRHLRVQFIPLLCIDTSRVSRGSFCPDKSRCSSRGPCGVDTSRCISGPYGIDMSRPAQAPVVRTCPGVGLCFADTSPGAQHASVV
jgi:hypothetical protein